MSGANQLLQLIDLLYEAVVEPNGWTLFLQGFSDALHGHAAILFTQDYQSAAVPFFAAVRSDPAVGQSYQDHYVSVNIWMRREENLRTGRAVTDQLLATDDELRGSEFYNDWLRPQHPFHALGGVVRRQGSFVSKISVLRPHDHGPYGTEEFALYRGIAEHLGRALDMQERLGHLSVQRAASEETLHHLTVGVLLLDTDRRILFANRAAEAICSGDDGLAIAGRALRAARPCDDRTLQQLLEESVLTGKGAGFGTGGMLYVARRSGRRPYSLAVSPIAPSASLILAGEPATVVFITDPETKAEVTPDALQRLYGLTNAEARLLAKLIDGEKLQDYAERNSVTMNTVRTQLAHIFSKTGTNRQAELVRLCLANPLLRIAGATKKTS